MPLSFRAPVLSSQLSGLFFGALLGAARTGQETAHLLAKNQALQAAQLPALPGAGHFEVMASSGPAWAGALFFGLSLGLGWGSLCGIWVRLARSLPGRVRWVLVAPLLVPGSYGAIEGDWGVAITLWSISAASIICQFRSLRSPASSTPLVQLILAIICGLGLLPWARAGEGPFTRLRDQILFSTPVGLAVDQFYYRWTLYPAEVLKPLKNRSQPVATLADAGSKETLQRFCRQAKRFEILCVPEPAVGDFSVQTQGQTPVLTCGSIRTPWPDTTVQQREAWSDFSAANDTQAILRQFTGWGLFFGCPLGLCWILAAGAVNMAAPLRGRNKRAATATTLTLIIAALLARSGMSNVEIATLRTHLQSSAVTGAEIQQALRSGHPAARFYAARGAPRFGHEAETWLLEALSDPVINVRYAAAQGLGKIGGEPARAALAELMRNGEEWYVKERAYTALQKIGWPRP